LPLKEGAERYAELYLIIADPEAAGPGTRRLAEILRVAVADGCAKAHDMGLAETAQPQAAPKHAQKAKLPKKKKPR
jgi:hypothetical protein